MKKPGITAYGRKFKARVFHQNKSIYVGSFDSIEECVDAQKKYRKENNLPEPKKGRPLKKK